MTVLTQDVLVPVTVRFCVFVIVQKKAKSFVSQLAHGAGAGSVKQMGPL